MSFQANMAAFPVWAIQDSPRARGGAAANGELSVDNDGGDDDDGDDDDDDDDGRRGDDDDDDDDEPLSG